MAPKVKMARSASVMVVCLPLSMFRTSDIGHSGVPFESRLKRHRANEEFSPQNDVDDDSDSIARR